MYKNSFILCNIFLVGFLKTLLSEVLVAQQNLQSSKYKNYEFKLVLFFSFTLLAFPSPSVL